MNQSGGVTSLPSRYRWALSNNKAPKSFDDLLSILLESRGLKESEFEHFLSPSYESSLHDPMLLPQAGAAVERISKAISSKEKIAVFGDYDVDGVTSSALITDVLIRLGAEVEVELPDREDGYGLSVEAVQRLAPNNKLLITVDNGTNAHEAVAAAISSGMDVVIIDHHTVSGALPPGALVVNPMLSSSNYPQSDLAAVAVAWKIATKLLEKEGYAGEERFLLDLVCLGTHADKRINRELKSSARINIQNINPNIDTVTPAAMRVASSIMRRVASMAYKPSTANTIKVTALTKNTNPKYSLNGSSTSNIIGRICLTNGLTRTA